MDICFFNSDSSTPDPILRRDKDIPLHLGLHKLPVDPGIRQQTPRAAYLAPRLRGGDAEIARRQRRQRVEREHAHVVGQLARRHDFLHFGRLDAELDVEDPPGVHERHLPDDARLARPRVLAPALPLGLVVPDVVVEFAEFLHTGLKLVQRRKFLAEDAQSLLLWVHWRAR